MLLSTMKRYMKDPVGFIWSFKNSVEILVKFKVRYSNATSLSTYDYFYSLHYFTS